MPLSDRHYRRDYLGISVAVAQSSISVFFDPYSAYQANEYLSSHPKYNK
jgi:hypothetical protein